MIEATSGGEWCHEYGADQAIADCVATLLRGRHADLPVHEEFSPQQTFAPLLARLGG